MFEGVWDWDFSSGTTGGEVSSLVLMGAAVFAAMSPFLWAGAVLTALMAVFRAPLLAAVVVPLLAFTAHVYFGLKDTQGAAGTDLAVALSATLVVFVIMLAAITGLVTLIARQLRTRPA